jgi:ABC-type transporter Mla subunit MlaD
VTVLKSLQADRPEGELDDAIDQFRSVSTALQRAADTSEQMLAESENVAGAAEEQAAELNEVSSRAEKLKRYARPLSDILSRFETESAHKFVFTGGPSQEVPDESDY